MKSSLIKMILPVAAFVLASAGAVTTKTGTPSGKSSATQGWARLMPGQPCQQVRSCNNLSNITCKQAGVQVYQLTGTDDCSTILFHSGV